MARPDNFTAARAIDAAALDGVTPSMDGDKVVIAVPDAAMSKWQDAIRHHKAVIMLLPR